MAGLRYHIKYAHEIQDKDKFNCEKCNKTFNSKSSLEDHVKSIHEGLRTDPCKLCGIDFANIR